MKVYSVENGSMRWLVAAESTEQVKALLPESAFVPEPQGPPWPDYQREPGRVTIEEIELDTPKVLIMMKDNTPWM